MGSGTVKTARESVKSPGESSFYARNTRVRVVVEKIRGSELFPQQVPRATQTEQTEQAQHQQQKR